MTSCFFWRIDMVIIRAASSFMTNLDSGRCHRQSNPSRGSVQVERPAPSPARGFPEGRRCAPWSMGLRGALKAPSSWGAGESEVSLASGATAIRCHPALTDPERLPLNTTVFIRAERRVMGSAGRPEGMQRGTRQRVPLAKMCGTTTHILRGYREANRTVQQPGLAETVQMEARTVHHAPFF